MSALEHPSRYVVEQPDLARATPPRWAWKHRIVAGYLNLLLGNEGVGKGVAFSWLAARWTHGELAGDFRRQPIRVGIVADEDSFDQVWTPRLHAAGADFTQIRHLHRRDGDCIDVGEDRERLMIAVELGEIKVLFYDQLLDTSPRPGRLQPEARPSRPAARPSARPRPRRGRAGGDAPEQAGKDVPRARGGHRRIQRDLTVQLVPGGASRTTPTGG